MSRVRSYKSVNRQGWTRLARERCDSCMPFNKEELAQAREWLDPENWIDWSGVRNVLCLASGGGQQAPMFGALGCHVVSADLCPDQLDRDREAAREHGYEIDCLEADMLDLATLHGRDFDLVYQSVSACYVPDVRRLYLEVSRVLKPGGYYRVEHWNPVNMQLDENWTGRGYELIRPLGSVEVWHGEDGNGKDRTECWHYVHSLTDLLGGLCDAGFRILHFNERTLCEESAEPGSRMHAYSFAPPFFSVYAQFGSAT